jgi:ElaB/YqjD/DUF883 family membrane-anchored ribosome-binding protein
MDDTTRGLAGDRDDMTGRADETTRNLDATASTPGSARVQPARPAAAAPRSRGSKPASTRGTSPESDLDPETEARTRQIQAEIADTREELSETIDALQEKLRPGNIVSDATEKVKTATTERVRHMAESAGETAQDMMRSTRQATSGIVEGARQNPIPALMIGIGVAWLLVDRTRNQGDRSSYRNAGRSQDWRRYGAAGDYDRSYGSRNLAAGTGVDLDDDAGYGYAEYGSDYAYGSNRGTSRSSMQKVSERASDMADSARTTLRRSTRDAQNGFQRMLRDNPLLVGAAAIVAGAAVGAALPETERENELMGETRDSVIDKAQDLARNAASTVQDVAGDAVKTVTDRVASGDTPQR